MRPDNDGITADSAAASMLARFGEHLQLAMIVLEIDMYVESGTCCH
jgi:hypothetical protein